MWTGAFEPTIIQYKVLSVSYFSGEEEKIYYLAYTGDDEKKKEKNFFFLAGQFSDPAQTQTQTLYLHRLLCVHRGKIPGWNTNVHTAYGGV